MVVPSDFDVSPGWATQFHSFSWLHLASLVWTIGPMVVACAMGRAWLTRGQAGREERFAFTWAVFLIAVNAARLVHGTLPAHFALETSLPIQPCDLACLTAPLLFLTRWRWPRNLMFFWGLGLSTIALVLPATLHHGPAQVEYYLYWFGHQAIVGSAVYDVVVRRYRPTSRDLVLTAAGGIAYLLAVTAINVRLDSNYGFVGEQALPGTPIAELGPWPDRIFVIAAIVIGLWWLMWLVASTKVLPTRPRVRSALGILTSAAFALGPALAGLRLIPALAGFLLFALGGIGAVLGGGASVVQWLRGGRLGMGGLPATVAGAIFVAILIRTAGPPPINDLTTDLEDPPVFTHAAALDTNVDRDMRYPAEFAAVQRKCCPDLRATLLPKAVEPTVELALDQAQASGWEVTFVDRTAGRLEAVATTPLFGFRDDLVIRIRPAPGGKSTLDVRSKSRDGTGDAGANAHRIRRFVASMEAAAAPP